MSRDGSLSALSCRCDVGFVSPANANDSDNDDDICVG